MREKEDLCFHFALVPKTRRSCQKKRGAAFGKDGTEIASQGKRGPVNDRAQKERSWSTEKEWWCTSAEREKRERKGDRDVAPRAQKNQEKRKGERASLIRPSHIGKGSAN